ncbi:hypothetical protein MPSEU_000526300 [Mayamaea pseudoterrestris]|nr:hypothetical protein MPSEU_000526300 [Mayamaea pseudoterrestris]
MDGIDDPGNFNIFSVDSDTSTCAHYRRCHHPPEGSRSAAATAAMQQQNPPSAHGRQTRKQQDAASATGIVAEQHQHAASSSTLMHKQYHFDSKTKVNGKIGLNESVDLMGNGSDDDSKSSCTEERNRCVNFDLENKRYPSLHMTDTLARTDTRARAGAALYSSNKSDDTGNPCKLRTRDKHQLVKRNIASSSSDDEESETKCPLPRQPHQKVLYTSADSSMDEDSDYEPEDSTTHKQNKRKSRFSQVTEHRYLRKRPSGAALKASNEDVETDDDDDDKNKDEEGSNDDDDSNKSSSKIPNEGLAFFKDMFEELREFVISGGPSGSARSHKEQKHSSTNDQCNFMQKVDFKGISDMADNDTLKELGQYASLLMKEVRPMSEDQALLELSQLGITEKELNSKEYLERCKAYKFLDPIGILTIQDCLKKKASRACIDRRKRYKEDPNMLYDLKYCANGVEQMVLPLSAKAILFLAKCLMQFFTYRAMTTGVGFTKKDMDKLVSTIFHTNTPIMCHILYNMSDFRSVVKSHSRKGKIHFKEQKRPEITGTGLRHVRAVNQRAIEAGPRQEQTAHGHERAELLQGQAEQRQERATLEDKRAEQGQGQAEQRQERAALKDKRAEQGQAKQRQGQAGQELIHKQNKRKAENSNPSKRKTAKLAVDDSVIFEEEERMRKVVDTWQIMSTINRDGIRDIVDEYTWEKLSKFASELLVKLNAMSEIQAERLCLDDLGIGPEKLKFEVGTKKRRYLNCDLARQILNKVQKNETEAGSEGRRYVNIYREESAALYDLVHLSREGQKMVLPLSAKAVYLLFGIARKFFLVRAKRSGEEYNVMHMKKLFRTVFYTHVPSMTNLLAELETFERLVIERSNKEAKRYNSVPRQISVQANEHLSGEYQQLHDVAMGAPLESDIIDLGNVEATRTLDPQVERDATVSQPENQVLEASLRGDDDNLNKAVADHGGATRDLTQQVSVDRVDVNVVSVATQFDAVQQGDPANQPFLLRMVAPFLRRMAAPFFGRGNDAGGLAAQIDALRQQIDALQQQLIAQQQSGTNNQSDIDENRDDIASVQLQLDKLDAKVYDMKQELAVHQQAVMDMHVPAANLPQGQAEQRQGQAEQRQGQVDPRQKQVAWDWNGQR